MVQLLKRLFGAKSGVLAIFQTAFANVAVQATNIACGVITARALGPEGRGALSAVIMWPQFLAYGMTLGVPVASVYFLKRRPAEASALVGAGLFLSLIFGCAAALVGLVVIPYSLHTYPPHIIHLAKLWVSVTPLALLAVTLMSQVQTAGAFTKFNVFRFLSPLSVLVTLLSLEAFSKLTTAGAAAAYLLAGTPATIWFASWVWSHYRPTLTAFRASARLLLSYGVRAWGADLLGTIASQVDRILVVGLLDPGAMGLYVVAQSAAGVLNVIPAAVVPVALPKASGLDLDAIVTLTGRAVRSTLYLMLLAAAPLFVLGAPLLSLVYGPKFQEAALVLPFLIAGVILDGMTAVLSQAFLAAGFPGTITMLQGCGLATSIPFLYFIIPRFGLRGAGCALMLTTLCRFLLVLAYFPIRLKKRPPGFLMGREEFSALFNRVRNFAAPQ